MVYNLLNCLLKLYCHKIICNVYETSLEGEPLRTPCVFSTILSRLHLVLREKVSNKIIVLWLCSCTLYSFISIKEILLILCFHRTSGQIWLVNLILRFERNAYIWVFFSFFQIFEVLPCNTLIDLVKSFSWILNLNMGVVLQDSGERMLCTEVKEACL